MIGLSAMDRNKYFPIILNKGNEVWWSSESTKAVLFPAHPPTSSNDNNDYNYGYMEINV